MSTQLPDDVITIRTTGLSAKEVIERLGGMGSEKPVRAVYIGADLFAAVERVERLVEDAVSTYEDSIPTEKVALAVDATRAG